MSSWKAVLLHWTSLLCDGPRRSLLLSEALQFSTCQWYQNGPVQPGRWDLRDNALGVLRQQVPWSCHANKKPNHRERSSVGMLVGSLGFSNPSCPGTSYLDEEVFRWSQLHSQSSLSFWVFPAEAPDIREQSQTFSAVPFPSSWPTESMSIIKWLLSYMAKLRVVCKRERQHFHSQIMKEIWWPWADLLLVKEQNGFLIFTSGWVDMSNNQTRQRGRLQGWGEAHRKQWSRSSNVPVRRGAGPPIRLGWSSPEQSQPLGRGPDQMKEGLNIQVCSCSVTPVWAVAYATWWMELIGLNRSTEMT